MASFKVSGFEGIDKALGELKKSTGKAVLRRVQRDALQPMAEHARSLAPLDEGDLRDSINVGTNLNKGARAQVQKADATDTETRVSMFMGTANRNAVPLEFGSIRTPPRAFMRIAWDSGREGLLRFIQDHLGDQIMKAAQRAAKRNGKGK